MCYGTENGTQTRFFDTIHNATEVWCLDSTQRDREHVLRHYTTTGQRSGVSTLHNRTETMCSDTTPTGQRPFASTVHSNGTETWCFETTQRDNDQVIRHYTTTGKIPGASILHNGSETMCLDTTQRNTDLG